MAYKYTSINLVGPTDQMKELVILLRLAEDKYCIDYPNSISDVLYKIETEYQSAHNLDENNWDLADNHEFHLYEDCPTKL